MYEKAGIIYPRVTNIISDCTNKSGGLVQWAANQTCEWIRTNCVELSTPFYVVEDDDLEQARFAYKDTSKIARDVGSRVHAWIEEYLGRKEYPAIDYDFYYKYLKSYPQAHNAIVAFLDWASEVELKPHKLEQTVWGDKWAGTMDFYGLYKGNLYVIDWKTSKVFYPEMRYQVAAYRSTLSGIEGCGVLMLDKETGMPTFKDTSKTYVKDLAVFNKMVELYFLRHPRIAKRFEKGEER